MKRAIKYLKLLAPAIIGGLFIILASLNINGSIWFDESYSAMLNRFEPQEIIQLTARDVHPPLYYLLLKTWGSLFGESDATLRMMSVFFGALSLLVAYLLIKRWFDRRTALIASIIMALSPTLIRYSQEMRMYMLATFLVLLATLLLTIAIDWTEDKSNKKTTAKRKILGYELKTWLIWLTYGSVVALGMLTHYFTAGAWVAHVIYLIYRFRRRIIHPQIIAAYVCSLLIFLPWVPSLIIQTRSVQNGFWIPEITGATLMDYFSDAVLLQPIWGLKGWSVFGLLFATILIFYLLIIGWKKLDQKLKQRSILILLIAIIPPIFLLLLSMPPLKPVFINRYITYASAALWLALGIAIATILQKKKRFRRVDRKTIISLLACLIVSVGALGLDIITGIRRESVGYAKPTMSIIMEQSRQTKGIMPVLAADELTFYQLIFYEQPNNPVFTIRSWRSVNWVPQDPLDKIKTNMFEKIEGFTAKYPRFWLVQKTDDKSETQMEQITKTHSPGVKINTGHYILTEFGKK